MKKIYTVLSFGITEYEIVQEFEKQILYKKDEERRTENGEKYLSSTYYLVDRNMVDSYYGYHFLNLTLAKANLEEVGSKIKKQLEFLSKI